MCRCACGDHPAPARGPKVPLYQLTPAGETWLREHPLQPLPAETPDPPTRYLTDEQRREVRARISRLLQ
jgi:hypothetical protein